MPYISRRTALMAAFAGITAPALASCSSNNQGSLGGGASPAASASVGGSKVTELTVATATTPWLDGYKAIVADYEKQTGVKVTLKPFPFDGLQTQQINAVQQKSNAFDVFQINEGWVGQFYGQGWLTPLKQIDPGFTWDSGVASFAGLSRWDAAQKVTSESGEVVALPLNGNIQLLAYRKDLYEKMGLQPPTTFDEAIANGKRAVAEGLAKYGYTARGQGAPGGNSVTFDFSTVLHGYGVEYVAKPGVDWTPTIAGPDAQSAMAKYLELLKLGPANPQTVDQAGVIAAMQSGDTLQGHMVAAVAPQLADPNKSKVAGKIGYAIVPGGPAGSAPISGAWTMGVPVGLPGDRAQAALAFMKWLVSKPVQTKWGNAGGVITRSDVLGELGKAGTHPDLAAMEASLPKVHAGVRFVFGTKLLQSTEVNFNKIVAGQVSIAEGMTQVATDLTAAVKEAGLT